MNKFLPILLVVVLSGCAASKKIILIDDVDTTPKVKILIDDYLYIPPGNGIFGFAGTLGLKSTDNEAYLKGYRDDDKCFGAFKGTQIDALFGELDSFFDTDFYVCEYSDLKRLYIIGRLRSDFFREFPIQNKYKIVNE